MNYKQILPVSLNYILKNLINFINQKEPNFANDSSDKDKRIFFLDAPAYSNIGDQAIAFAMESFMKKILPDYAQFEIQEDHTPKHLKWLKKNIREDDIICLTGGGNMGVLYPRYESLRRLIINEFSRNLIIVFPQTYDYEDSPYGIKEKEKAIRIYNKAERLLLMAREERSYDLMKEDFKNCNVILCPDIVLSLNYSKSQNKRKNVGICLRNDLESIFSEEEREEIKSSIVNNCELTTVISENKRITGLNRKSVVEKLLLEFQSKELVLTDRLHGMIFAYITNTPCIAFPNSNGKVEGVFRWIQNGNVKFFYSKKDYFNSFSHEEVCFSKSGNNTCLENAFKEIENEIKMYLKK